MPLKPIPLATHDPRSVRATILIEPADLLRSVYVVGKTGAGKSVLLERLLLGAVDSRFGACLVDPHGDLARSVLEHLPSRHWNRLVHLAAQDTTAPVGLNLLSPEPNMSRALVASGLVEVFRKLWGPELFGPRSEHLLRNAVLALLETPDTTLLGLLRMLVDQGYRMRIVARVTDPVVRNFWLREFSLFDRRFATEVMAPVLNKLGALSAPAVRRIVGQVGPRLRLREALDESRILICDLSGIGRDAAQLLGALLVTGIGLAAQSRAGTPEAERRPFLLVADEFHAYTTASFAMLLAEGRKFGLCAALAHQHAHQLEKEIRGAILGNVGTLVAFALSADDAKLLTPEFAPEVEEQDLVRLRRYHIALRLLQHGESMRPTICETIPPPQRNGGPPATLLRISRERYGRPSDVVDREIAEALGQSVKPLAAAPKEEPPRGPL